MRLLCLSNGHGEDAIASKILQQLQLHPQAPEVAALPLVGIGGAYTRLGIPLAGRTQAMPSGGFIYMDGKQFWRDVRGGLLQLLWQQWRAIRSWRRGGGIVLAVGDIVPLLLAWLSGADYYFVGTAKSEYYLRDEAGQLPGRPWWDGWSGSVYLPWERWLMTRSRCRGVFPRDKLTTDMLCQKGIKAFDLGNPMMDDLVTPLDNPDTLGSEVKAKENLELAEPLELAEIHETRRSLTILFLPGSRPPEAYENWQLLTTAMASCLSQFSQQPLLFLAAIVPSLDLDTLTQVLPSQGWQPSSPLEGDRWSSGLTPAQQDLVFTYGKATLILTVQGFREALLGADFAVAMAGTATEQAVGLGKPAIAIPGKGPQYTYAFAEAQTRLLGASLILVKHPNQVAKVINDLLQDADRLQLINENGRRRLGKPGAGARIAEFLLKVQS